ncbi:MAG: ATP synthase F1 subunit gamma [Sporomusaceae bacterium]|jgi:F-type H+-transporting ATPase subunit gamma|nr:ATP synthase F1 subunit gamma [Sporomusaceae bacterium]
MPSAKDIRRRIKSVKNIQQITKAMKMVAAARLRRAQELAAASRPYTEKIKETLANVAANISEETTPNALLEVREEVKNIAYLVISADKGLAGAYSSNLFREVLPLVKGKDNVSLVTVGRKTRDYFRRRGYKIDNDFIGFSEKPSYQNAQMLAKYLAQKFTQEENPFDEIYLAYTFFHSPVNLKPTIVKLLPVERGSEEQSAEKKSGNVEYIFVPTANDVLNLLLPKYLETIIYNALLQSAASELGARMTAMGSATDNAQELIAKLTLNYNKVRQAAITREISEIVGGANALK